MKIGDLVKSKRPRSKLSGVVIEITEKKHWNTKTMGKKINWSNIDPEPHVTILTGRGTITVPCVAVEVIDENR